MATTVLSLFDGISCGQVALDKLNIQVDKYYASEVDKYAIKITQANFPLTVQLGDIQKVHVNDHIDILLGGPPCQDVSYAGKGKGLIEGSRSSLFFEFVRVLREAQAINPGLKFLVENTKMKKEYVDIISAILGVKPVLINSNVFSAQNRARLYWTNFKIPELPGDKGIILADILEDEVDSRYHVGKKLVATYRGGDQLSPNYTSQSNTIHSLHKKSPALCAGTHGYALGYICKTVADNIIYRRLTPLECERLQTLPDNFTAHVSNTQRYKGIGNGWTVDVICHILGGLK